MKTFTNPVLRGFNPDPSVARFGDDFFLITSSFEYFPGIPIYHSRDLVNWTHFGHALTRPSQLNMRTVEPSAGIWASTIRYHDGRFFITTAKWDRYRPQTDERIFPRGFYVSTNNIWDDQSWSDPICFDNPGFDQDLFWDKGRTYLSTTVRMANRPKNSQLKDFAIHISEVDLLTGRTLTAPEVIRSSPHGIAEGSHIIKRNQYYYLFTAEGGTEAGHQEWVSRSSEGPLGPWELGPTNPLWYNGTDGDVQNTGHCDVFEDGERRWWAVLLAVRPRRRDGVWQESQLGRETFLVRVDWKDDWPVFNNGTTISILTDGPDVSQVSSPLNWTADLKKDTVELGWYQKHTPVKQEWSLTARPGFLRLHGGCYNLSSPESPTMLLRKQTAFKQSFEAVVDFRPSKAGYEAGVVLWWSMYSYASIGITVSHNKDERILLMRTPTAEIGVMTEMMFPVRDSDPLSLRINGDDLGYYLSALKLGSVAEPHHAVYVQSNLFPRSPPVGGAFTGTMFGIYSFGAGEPCLDPADFSQITIRTHDV